MQQPDNTKSFGSWFWGIWAKIWWLIAIALAAVIFYLAFSNPKLLVRLFGLVFIGCGIGGLLYGGRTRLLQRQSQSWFPVDGEIIRAELEKETRTSHGGSQTTTFTFYRPRVEYSYDFQGKAYRSRRIIVANINWPRQEAEDALARYPVGSTTTVWVNPNRPKMAVLEPGMVGKTKKYVAVFLIGVLFLCAGIVTLFIAPLVGR